MRARGARAGVGSPEHKAGRSKRHATQTSCGVTPWEQRPHPAAAGAELPSHPAAIGSPEVRLMSGGHQRRGSISSSRLGRPAAPQTTDRDHQCEER